MKSVFEKLKELSLPHIKNFHNDLLVHDKAYLDENDYPFIHATRESGTHMVPFCPADIYPAAGETVPYYFGHSDRYHILRQANVLVDHIVTKDNVKLILYYNGRFIKKITAEQAIRLTREYTDRIKREWDRVPSTTTNQQEATV